MLEGALEGTVGFLALLGAVALALRSVRSSVLFILQTAEIAAVSGSAESSARRGDLTTLGDARSALVAARARRRRSAAVTLAWGLWLIVPLLTDLLPEAWALAAPLWILPGISDPRRPG